MGGGSYVAGLLRGVGKWMDGWREEGRKGGRSESTSGLETGVLRAIDHGLRRRTKECDEITRYTGLETLQRERITHHVHGTSP